ncbi:MAG: hypothetical protein MJ207_01180 [Bacilli bacterium]|nr:hypothetical protein [Bacilli bacterium]
MKKREISPSVTRQLQILSDHYDIDEERKIITVVFFFEDISEVLNPHLAENKLPQFNHEFVEEINDILDTFPLGYKADIKINADNLRGYKPEDLLTSLRHSLELYRYVSKREGAKNFVLAMIMMGIGIFALFMMVLSEQHQWFEDETIRTLVTEIIDIIAWVFVWEAVTMIMLNPSEYRSISVKLITKINTISVTSLRKHAEITAADMLDHYVDDKSYVKAGNSCLLIGGVALAALAIPNAIRSMINAYHGEYGTGTDLAFAMSLAVIFALLCLASGIIAIMSYLTGKRRYYITARILIPLTLAFNIAIVVSLAYWIARGAYSYPIIITRCFELVLSLLCGIGLILKRRSKSHATNNENPLS